MSYSKLGGFDDDDDDFGMEVRVTDVKPRSFSGFDSGSPLLSDTDGPQYQEEDVHCGNGTVHVAVQGDMKKPAIVTYHDIGLNHVTCFQGFFNCPDMQPILKRFCVYHLNAPGQHKDASPLPTGYVYPDMDGLAEMILPVLQHFGIKEFIGFGVGAGANILARFELEHPTLVRGLTLINCVASTASWSEWGHQKFSSFYLKGKGMTNFSQEYLLWHYFGKKTLESNHDLVAVYRENLAKSVNPANLAQFINSYIKRTDLNIVRELEKSKKKDARTLKCNTMLICGKSSPHINDTVEMNGRLDPANSTWVNISDCGGMILEEQPSKLAESFRYYLQGLGYAVNLKVLAPAKAHEQPDTFRVKKGHPSPVML
ncbi:protein NDRG3-like isoform X2 [Anneissia japonica]|uniref:protein NDRG3-like isoform X2 n=1 Tax=Anneissia japonica TaxID=1529436 RepID=UPI0014257B49|nr:protein NDRG3-like isoform X2 [Anneissia japonica]